MKNELGRVDRPSQHESSREGEKKEREKERKKKTGLGKMTISSNFCNLWKMVNKG